MAKYGSNLSTFTLTILKEQTYLCQNQLSGYKIINKNKKGNIKQENIKQENICADDVVWELEEVAYSCEPIFI